MNIKRGLFTISLLLVLLLINGCSKTNTDIDLNKNTYTGTEGVTVKFMTDYPPARLYIGPSDTLNIIAELENKGAYDATGILFIEGFDSRMISIFPKSADFNLDKKERDILGGYQTKEFSSNFINWQEGQSEVTQPIVLTALYDYETTASASVCLDPQISGLYASQKACTAKTVSLSGGQGAPVAVTRVESEMASQKAYFTIYIKNMGTGDVWREGTSDIHNIPFTELNKVYYDVSLSGVPGECKPDNPITLNKDTKEGKILCVFDITSDKAEQRSMQIILDYTYSQSIKKEIKLIKVD